MTPFRYRDGALPNAIALGYTLVGHAGGVALLARGGVAGRVVGGLLVVHTLMLATYLVHECMHETLFRGRGMHARFGTTLAWLTGAGYAGFDTLRKKHLHHHLDRADPITLDFRSALAAASPPLRRTVLALEWMHFPALELWLRGYAVRLPFTVASGEGRGRVIALVGSRLAAGGLLCVVSPCALLLYWVASVAALVATRFFDAFHHTFDLMLLDSSDAPFGAPAVKDRRYENANTYSNLLSSRWPSLNLLLLNFPYHNAHHAKPGVPWHRLPALDRGLYGADPRRILAARTLLGAFHRYRIERLLGVATFPPVDERLLGATGVSLLTL